MRRSDIFSVAISNSMSWKLKKIIPARELLHQLGGWNSVVHNDKYSIKKAYKLLMGSFEKVEWSRLICNNKASPKSKFTLWMVLQNRLPTADRLSKWNIPSSIRCKLCEAEDESIQHLFFTRDYATTIWKVFIARCIGNTRLVLFVKRLGRPGSKLVGKDVKLGSMLGYFIEAVYAIWL
ncbi:uncharacterized protein LOC104906927 [Beta vulgaris subsp. vulgaris]|uniref:uncharacterized protein LOC104906927 n=1 Tax=Beta vulgaris subsp. vulgaris TaxID=3555 RepID=UPI0005400F87|nr:uncharacterized protein LOC104906927 [Beta vulgaris subsp. vulgaris]